MEGIGPATQPAHVVRATVEGLAAQVALLARAAAADLGRPLARLRVDGGLTNSRLLMQTQADLLQVPVEVASSPHATAAGVGALARLGADPGLTLDGRGRTGPSRRPPTSRGFPPTRRPSAWPASNAPWRCASTRRAARRRERRPLLRRRHHRRRGGRHGHRSSAGALPAAHRDPRAGRRRGHRHLQGEHGDRPHRFRHRAREPGIDLGPAGSRSCSTPMRAPRASPSRRRAPSWWPGTRNKRPGSTTCCPRRGPTGTSAPPGSPSTTSGGANRTSATGPPVPSSSRTSRSSARGARASRSPPRRSAPASSCGSGPPSPA